MGALRRGVVGLTVLAGIGLAAPAAVADDTRIAGPAYYERYERPSIWSGLYGGVHLGHADADHDDSFVGGVQLGYNWQANQIVYGLEGDISLSGMHSIDWLASVRGRAGYLIQPRLMIYATAGLGLVNGGDTDAGFVYGLGVEGKLTPTMSARIEYLSFNSDGTHGDGVGVIRAGLNIKLGP
jgi:outer membrane immunogenic protein